MKHWFATIAMTSALFAAATAQAEGSAEAGAAKSAICSACHGANGNSVNPEWPSLAGQHAEYIAEQLQLFKSGVRNNPVMLGMAVGLSDADMADLGAYFSAQTLTGLEADPSLYKQGEQLYRAGDTKRGLPACIACHGPQGKGNGPARYPEVRAQHSLYTYNQLKSYAANLRYVAVSGQSAPANAEIMQTIAAKLTDDEMRALASYLQGLR
jgi:cytochrome c553